jgi:ubiquinone/menaquinone biosynthesis C-methylase UbiE
MSSRSEGYIPAAGHDWLLPLYDPLWRFVFREERLRREILAHAQIGSGCRVLDVGCGTGTQAVLVKQTHPDAEVVGIDGDEKVLAIARRKAERAGAEVLLDEGLATALPYADARFDRVLSSLVFHHLEEADKRRAAAEILRVLAPGGAFLLVDFGAPVTRIERACAHLLRHGGHARLHLEGRLPALLRDAGFGRVAELARLSMGFGRVWFWRARA